MKDDIVVKNGIVIPAHELTITTSRAGGPGGQHVNKTDTRVTIHWNVANSKALTETQKQRVLDKLEPQLTEDGNLIVHNGSTRSQLQNRKLAYQQLAQKVRRALHVPKKRMKTRISKGVKEKRLQEKKQRSELKKLRQKKDY